MNTHCKLGKARSGQSTVENLLLLCCKVATKSDPLVASKIDPPLLIF